MRVPQHDTNLGRGGPLLGSLANQLFDLNSGHKICMGCSLEKVHCLHLAEQAKRTSVLLVFNQLGGDFL